MVAHAFDDPYDDVPVPDDVSDLIIGVKVRSDPTRDMMTRTPCPYRDVAHFLSHRRKTSGYAHMARPCTDIEAAQHIEKWQLINPYTPPTQDFDF